MNTAKTDIELWPGRVLGKLRRALTDLEKDKGDEKLAVTNVQAMTALNVGDHRAVHVNRTGAVRWLEFANQMYSGEDLAMIAEWAQS